MTFIRQTQYEFTLSVTLTLNQGEAGVTLWLDEKAHYDLGLRQVAGKFEVFRRLRVGDLLVTDHVTPLTSATVTLEITGTPRKYHFAVNPQDQPIDCGTAHTKYLSSEVAGGFTGVMLGLFTQAVGPAAGSADFTSFTYQTEGPDPQ